MTTTDLDLTRLDAFAGEMMGVLNSGMLCLSLSLAHQSGLLDTLAALPPSTSEDIAAAAGLQERYVRENLGALTTGGVVEHDEADDAYFLPPEHAACLTTAAGPNNLALMMQMVPMCAGVEQEVLRCFREGGGVPYDRYPTFHRRMAEFSQPSLDATLIDGTVDLVPDLRAALERGIDVADVGCGSGYAINLLARTFPKSRFTGYDLCAEPIATATAQAGEWGLDNASFEQRDVTELGETEAYDWIITLDAVHDQAHPDRVLAGIAQALRPDGVYFCVDVAASSHVHGNLEHPLGPMLYTVSTMHCMTVSLAYDGMGLGAVWGEQTAQAMLADAGFTSVTTERVEGDPINVTYVARKS
jgi:2-polyprenyl-3-methyl-5-hydroxy-6-metoxy-1,4-benzoquinol methylase